MSYSRVRIITISAGVFVVLVTVVAVFAYSLFNAEVYRPLQKAAHDEDIGHLRRLWDSGTDVSRNSSYRNWTALHAAADAGQVEAAKLLIDRGATMDDRDNDGLTPLALAGLEPDGLQHPVETEAGRNAVAILLIHHGADLKAKTNAG